MKKSKEDCSKLMAVLIIIYILSLVPILLASVYAYPQADDWNYSWRTHLAWVDTKSLLAVWRAVMDTVCESYMNWQGTFSSIALMSLQPGIFGERYYMCVPFIMIGLISVATLLFFKELFREVKGKAPVCVALLVMIMTVQCMISKPVAFYWYNGAVHYIVMYCVGVLLVTSLLRNLRSRQVSYFSLFMSCILAVILGGGNLVTGLSGVVGFVSLTILSYITRRRRRIVFIIPPMLCNIVAFGFNIAAPGNWIRQGAVGEQSNPVMSVLRSFYYGIYFPLDRWMNWTIILFILVLVPLAWKIVKNVSFAFPVPMVVAVYSYCFISAMFTPSDFAAHTVELGRVQNAIFSVYILVLTLNVIYIVGWCQSHIKVTLIHSAAKDILSRVYYLVLALAGVWCVALFAVPSPEYFTTALAVHDLADGSAEECGNIAKENIEALKNGGVVVSIKAIPKDSALLTSSDIDLWHYGTKYFYRKDKVNVLEQK